MYSVPFASVPETVWSRSWMVALCDRACRELGRVLVEGELLGVGAAREGTHHEEGRDGHHDGDDDSTAAQLGHDDSGERMAGSGYSASSRPA